MTRKPILCLDFDGVIHSYTSGWKGADVIPDPPVPGAMAFIDLATDFFTVAIYSSRSGQRGGVKAMKAWMQTHMRETMGPDRTRCDDVLAEIQWPTEKPPAMVTIDDRALTFTGEWPSIDMLKAFQPWNKGGKEGRFGWIVANSDQDLFRVWLNGMPEWTSEKANATRYYRREDAEAVHMDDEEVWYVLPFEA